jgi:hypothetical protein
MQTTTNKGKTEKEGEGQSQENCKKIVIPFYATLTKWSQETLVKANKTGQN